ncbi:MAG: hypothetical protein IPH81_03250 [Candidatus Microthrix sp.]|nr:hypothetical protein [Candidatus Microthrix sp.]
MWLSVIGFRRIADMVRCDRKTVTKIVRIAEALGLVRTDSPERLTDDFVGAVMVELAPARRIVTASRGRRSPSIATS